jgi:hypothetical protein
MAYDSKDERSNNPKEVNRRLGMRELPDSAAGNAPGGTKEIGNAIENGWDTDRKRK